MATKKVLIIIFFNQMFVIKMSLKHKKSDVRAILSVIEILAADRLKN